MMSITLSYVVGYKLLVKKQFVCKIKKNSIQFILE